jgi:MFS transporter, FHS family, L-fucose permease
VIALFGYVGAQVGTWSYLITYAQKVVPGTSELVAADYLTISMVCLMVGRFSSTFMMRYFQPSRMMALFAAANTLLALLSVLIPGHIGVYALIVSSYFMSLMFPTIFALSIKGLGDDTKLGSSVLIMAIIGGAIITALMGWISDISSITYAFIIPCVVYAFVAWYSLKGCHYHESPSK